MPKVTEALRVQWANQRAQSIEEREYTQSGRKRSSSDIEIVDFEIKLMDRMLELPLGTKFDGQEVQRQLQAELYGS
jgi:uncharacterized protein YjaZ